MKYLALILLALFFLQAQSYTYLSWQKHNIHNHITIHFFSPKKRFTNLFVQYTNSKQQQTAFFSETKIAFIDYTYTRSKPGGGSSTQTKYKYLYIYHVTLDQLQPGCECHFTIHSNSDHFTYKQQKFVVPPTHKLRFIAGGDMGYAHEQVVPILQQAAAKSPHLALIGGDIAYANGKKKNLSRWLSWFQHWQENMISKEGHLIPMILAIGNHEVNRSLFTTQAPFYFGFFFQGGKPFFTRKLGQNATLIVLDSDHIYSYSSQHQWLATQLYKYHKNTFTLAMYHVPLYPAHRKLDNRDSRVARQLWLPLFDRYQLDLALEHHDHAFKRSKPLRNNRVVDNGTIYLGDGSFGRSPRSVEKRYYIEKALKAKHFWFFDINDNSISIEAIDDTGKILDKFLLQKKEK